ncbi:MAG: hypothetical protein H6728_16465 [Myxococcales bacterium]|nr:hypothetical protein [Myxococcales bacterium]
MLPSFRSPLQIRRRDSNRSLSRLFLGRHPNMGVWVCLFLFVGAQFGITWLGRGVDARIAHRFCRHLTHQSHESNISALELHGISGQTQLAWESSQERSLPDNAVDCTATSSITVSPSLLRGVTFGGTPQTQAIHFALFAQPPPPISILHLAPKQSPPVFSSLS